MNRFLLTLPFLVFASGCATMTQGTSQEIAVVTPGVEGAQCVIAGGDGQVIARIAAPGSARVSRARSALAVTCEKAGYRSATAEVPSSFSSRSRIQSPIGYAVDGISGAMWSYPAEVSVTLVPVAG